MHVLLITQEAPFSPEQVATGNAIRTLQLSQALESAGHSTRQLWLATDKRRGANTFNNTDRLSSLIRSESPGAILVSYWELLSLLPFGLEQPVILDFVAPRPLEELFENPEQLGTSLHRLRANLARCDLLLTGNPEQESLLAYWLLEAGFDLRKTNPVRVVPLGGTVYSPPSGDPGKDGWTLVGGGVNWPWRDAGEWIEAIRRVEQRQPESLRLVLFGGNYRWHEDDESAPDNEHWDLAAYNDYSAFLTGSTHIGLELAAVNLERRYSQSFRSLDFLRHGLPLLCNDWLPIAADIRAHEAGWTIGAPGEIPALLERIMADPAEWRRRSDNALRYARQALAPPQSAAALLEWLEAPAHAARLPGWGLPPAATPVLGVPARGERLKRRYRLARRIMLNRLFSRGGAQDGNGIVLVSRGDLFPTDHGAAVKIVETARGLSRNGRKVALVTDQRSRYWIFDDGEMSEHRFPVWMKLLSRPLSMVKLGHYTKDIPESNAFLYLPLSDGSFFWRCLYAGAQIQASIFQAEFPAYAKPCIEAAQVLEAGVVLVEHNVEYARLRQQVPELTDEQYAHFSAIEIDLCNRSGAVICVSDNDRLRLAGDGVHPGLLHTIPHGIDLPGFNAAEPWPAREKYAIPEDEPLLVYHGTFVYPPNRDALQVLADEVLPRLEAMGTRAHVLAVGHSPPREALHPRMYCTGSVESIAPMLKAADLAVIPLREGGGTRMKIIDCYAAGLPVVCTSKGIEGIPATHREQAMICDDWDDMCAAIRELIGQPELARDMANAGAAVAAKLDWREIGRRYLKVYAGIEG